MKRNIFCNKWILIFIFSNIFNLTLNAGDFNDHENLDLLWYNFKQFHEEVSFYNVASFNHGKFRQGINCILNLVSKNKQGYSRQTLAAKCRPKKQKQHKFLEELVDPILIFLTDTGILEIKHVRKECLYFATNKNRQ